MEVKRAAVQKTDFVRPDLLGCLWRTNVYVYIYANEYVYIYINYTVRLCIQAHDVYASLCGNAVCTHADN